MTTAGIRGLSSYTGRKIHGVRWDHDYDPAGQRVAVIGTGAGAARIVPDLVMRAESVKVFQRTPGWVLPRTAYARTCRAKSLHRLIPIRMIEMASEAYLRTQVKDPWLRRQLRPDHRVDRASILVTSDYYRALQRPNCKLISWPIATLSPDGIRTSDGIEHQVDCIVFAPGNPRVETVGVANGH